MKRLLTEERVPGASAGARFVSVEAYEAAGGQVLRDLFARDDERGVWFEGPVLVEKLATGKLQAAADELATRWKWAVAMIEVEWGDTARYGRIEPQPAERTPEEQAEIERLETRQAELAETEDDSWTEELLAEAETIETRLDEIEGAIVARATWRREDFAMAGCIVTIAHDGSLQVIQGLVKTEDMPKRTESDGAGANATGCDDTEASTHGAHATGPSVSIPMALPKDREAEARKEAGVGIGLADDLRSIRTALVKAYLVQDFEVAFDLMLFQMGRSVFTHGYTPHTAVERARRILAEIEAAEQAIDVARSGRTGVFRVTATPPWTEAVLACAAARFREGFPAVELRIGSATRAEGLRRLAERDCDLHCGGIDTDEPLPALLQMRIGC